MLLRHVVATPTIEGTSKFSRYSIGSGCDGVKASGCIDWCQVVLILISHLNRNELNGL